MAETYIVLCTCPDEGTGEELASLLVKHELAACVNLVPGLRSFYRWEGRVENDPEVLLVIKTSAAAYAALEESLRANHPYELPEIIAVPIDKGLTDYLDWIKESTNR